MVLDFVDEYNGYLALSIDEYWKASEVYGSGVKNEARVWWEIGRVLDVREVSFIDTHVDSVVKIAEIKCPKSKGYKSGVGFDNSSCHTPYAEDALIATHMNAKPGGPGGKQVYIISCPWLCDPENI